MAQQWMAIEERVPGNDGAVRQQAASADAPSRRSRIVESIIAAVEEEQRAPVWLVAPSRRVARQWIDAVALGGLPVFNVRATTPRALCYDIAAPLLTALGRSVASQRASLVLLEKVLVTADRGGRLRYFKSPRSYRRLTERMFASLSALRMASVVAEDVRRRDGVAGTTKGHDIALLLEDYAAELAAENLADAADIAAIALAMARADQLPPEVRCILIPDELSLRPLESRVFEALGDRVRKLPIDPEPESFTTPESGPMPCFFRAIGDVNEVRGVLRRCLAAGIPLDTVELLHTDAATYPTIIQEVLSVMAGSRAGEGKTTAELPVTFAEGLPIRESRPARALASWLAWRAEGHPQWRLVRMLRDGLLDWNRVERTTAATTAADAATSEPRDDEGEDLVDVQESAERPITQAGLLRELRRLRIGFDLSHAADKVRAAIVAVEAAPLSSFVGGSRDPDEEQEFDEETAVRGRDRRLASLRVLAKVLARLVECEPPPGGTAAGLVQRARLFLEQVAAARSEFDNNAKNRLVAELADMERWLAKHPGADPRETLEWLAGLADTLVVMGTAARPGCLHVASIGAGGHSGRPHTFIVGLDENRFPGPATSDPVLPDADRAAISDALEVGAVAAAKVRADFWRLLGRLRGDVHLSYSCRDLVQQAEVFPSPLLLEVYRRHAGAPQATLAEFLAAIADQTESFVPHDPASALNGSEWWLATLGENPSMAAVRQAVMGHGPALARGIEAEEHRRSSRFTEWDGLVPAAGPELDPTNPAGREASAHSLEALGACPRRFFFRYGLEVKPIDSLEPEQDRWLDDMEHGNVLHTVLERFMRRFLHTGPGRPADSPQPRFAEHEADILAVLDDVLEGKRSEKPTSDEAAVAACRREVAAALRTFLRVEERYCADTGCRPVALEAAIGFLPKREGTEFDCQEPVALSLDGGRTLRLRGFVDRIDIDGREGVEQGYTIIDYKKGRSTRFKKSGKDALAVFDDGRRLQHGLYVLMVRHVVRGAVGDAGHVTRFSYLFPGVDTHGERLEWTAEQLAGVDTLVEKLCGIVAAGAFLPTTVQDDCSFCDFLDVCGDKAATTQAARRKLRNDEGRYGPNEETLTELFDGVREAKDQSPVVAVSSPTPQPFMVADEPPPDGLGDAAAREAIRTALDRSMLVEASAGTGKTTCMVDRMTALVRTGKATASQIAAITFTKKAAAELARRFRERLEKDSADAAMLADERQRLQAALAEIDTVVIGTVHSFCGRLLKDRPIEAGLDPAVETMDAAAEQVLRGRAWREFCDMVPGDGALAASRQALEDAGVDLRDLRSAFETFVAHGDVGDWPCEPVDPPDVKAVMERLCGEITTTLEGVFVPWNERAVSDRLMNTLEAVRQAYSARPDDSPASLFRAAEKLEGACPKMVQSLWLPGPSTAAHRELQKARVEELDTWWNNTVAALAGPLAQWRAYRYQFVIPLLERAREHYEHVRLAEGLLSFHDLLDRTARLLRKRPDVRVAFARRHPFLLVDEFQDTDPLQAEILLLLTANADTATDWRSATIKPGSLFVVGDPKQSIYRFRRADIDTFEFVKKRIGDCGGEILHLSTNFRSNRELVTWVNGRFTDRFDEHRKVAEEHYGPEFTASHVGRGGGGTGMLAGLRQLRVRTRNVRVEAEAVATFIRQAIDHGLTVPRASAKEDAACRPEDFMIVTWDTGELSTYAEALNAVGLPCDVTGRKGPDSREDLALLQLCLRVVADADDTVAALAVLRGPVFGFSDVELHAFRQAGGRIDGRLFVPERVADDQLAARLRSAAETFRRWRRLAGSLPLAAALERIADDAGLLLVASVAGGRAGRRGRAAAGAIATLIERVRAERALLTSVQDVVDRIDDLVADALPRQDFDTVSIDASAGGAVRVMNLHKVKGLEAPVVFLCDEGAPDRDRGPSWHVTRSEQGTTGYLKIARAGLFGKSGTTLATPLDWQQVEETERRYIEAEYLRLNYVAGTRPGTCLVVSVFEDSKGNIKGGWHELSPDIASVSNLPDLGPHAEAERARTTAAARPLAYEDAVAAAREQAVGRVAAIRRATFGTVTPRDFLTEPAERIRHTGRGMGQDWGTVIHRLLELAVQKLADGQTGFDLSSAAANVVAESDLAESGIDRKAMADRAVALVEEILRSGVWRRIEAAAERHVEVPFSIAVSIDEIPAGVEVDVGPGVSATDAGQGGTAACLAASALPVLIRGQIDAVFREPSTAPPAGMTDWVILDWKTTSVTAADAERLVDHYRPQLRLYARCWAAGLPRS
jgi:ATP-dependent exoDNAse (exonuclease V) beta subunit